VYSVVVWELRLELDGDTIVTETDLEDKADILTESLASLLDVNAANIELSLQVSASGETYLNVAYNTGDGEPLDNLEAVNTTLVEAVLTDNGFNLVASTPGNAPPANSDEDVAVASSNDELLYIVIIIASVIVMLSVGMAMRFYHQRQNKVFSQQYAMPV
jgi:hypothetical protein